jgi:hypothetical protein
MKIITHILFFFDSTSGIHNKNLHVRPVLSNYLRVDFYDPKIAILTDLSHIQNTNTPSTLSSESRLPNQKY